MWVYYSILSTVNYAQDPPYGSSSKKKKKQKQKQKQKQKKKTKTKTKKKNKTKQKRKIHHMQDRYLLGDQSSK